MKRIERDINGMTEEVYVLESGKEFSANADIIGIDDFCVPHQGYDGMIQGYQDFSKQDREELANYMIALWEKYKMKGINNVV